MFTKLVFQEISANKNFHYIYGKWSYRGPLGNFYSMPTIVKIAYTAWLNQGRRCNNPKNPDYKFYGAKGTKRLWDARECIDFFINNLLKRDYWKQPAFSRIGDAGNYCGENCRLIEQAENRAEMKFSKKSLISSLKKCKDMARTNQKKVSLTNATGKILRFNSVQEAGLKTGHNKFYITKCMKLGRSASYLGEKWKIKLESNVR